jgi:hypothetical protein
VNKDITHESLSEEVIKAFGWHYGSPSVQAQELDLEFLQQQQKLKVCALS